MLSSLLKEKTRESHQQLEKLLIYKIKSIESINDYRKILQWFYSFYHPLEEKINQYLNPVIIPDYSIRRKSASLISDLYATGSESLPPLNDDLSEINTIYNALGALYVMEGSTLGGQIISQMIKNKLSLEDSSMLKFFNSYGNEVYARWSSFQNFLNNYPATQEQKLLVVLSANKTFMDFKVWIENNE